MRIEDMFLSLTPNEKMFIQSFEAISGFEEFGQKFNIKLTNDVSIMIKPSSSNPLNDDCLIEVKFEEIDGEFNSTKTKTNFLYHSMIEMCELLPLHLKSKKIIEAECADALHIFLRKFERGWQI